MDLSERDRHMLDFERACFTLPGTKESAIRARFAMSPASYYRILRDLLDDEASYRYDPLTVKRLRRDRALRRRQRIEGRRADPGSR
ncbi:MAG: DUF3263 domain-containing protein [Acidimicrobiia bacterium]|nr:DUF3263 domain-containing protein [Acidimicrobiia bacterium]